jgi:hypothetical protein
MSIPQTYFLSLRNYCKLKITFNSENIVSGIQVMVTTIE